jgi:hypothetical protein
MGGADEQERRGCSAFLAVTQSVKEFGRALTNRCGAPAGTLETFIEVPFELGGSQFRPDGLIRVTRGKTVWTALVEVKTGHVDLKAEQVATYLDIAREQNFDAVITISHQVATTPGVHPVSVDKRKLKRVGLFHLSWSRIHTEAIIEETNHAVSDPDQAWILSEFVRFLESKKSGAMDFDDMGADWPRVRDAAALQTLRAGSQDTLAVVARFDQLLAYAGMELSRQLGVNVQQRLTKKERSDHASRLQSQSAVLVKSGQLTGSLMVPNAAAPLDIKVDLRANRVECSVLLAAPTEGRASTRINWMLRQLRDSPSDLLVTATSSRAKSAGPSVALGIARENPNLLLDAPQTEVRGFCLSLSAPAGTKRGQGRGSFVGSVTSLVDKFYAEVVQYLKVWAPPAPKPKSSSDSQAAEDVAEGDIEVAAPSSAEGSTASGPVISWQSPPPSVVL